MLKTEVRVAGVTFKNPDKSSRQEILGLIYDDLWLEGREDEVEITLEREPDNAHDHNAVKVLVSAPEGFEGQIGYIPAEQAEWLSPEIQAGHMRSASLQKMGCMRGGKVWISIIVETSTDRDSPEEDNTIEDEDGNVYDFDF